jgi:hypothetical protein
MSGYCVETGIFWAISVAIFFSAEINPRPHITRERRTGRLSPQRRSFISIRSGFSSIRQAPSLIVLFIMFAAARIPASRAILAHGLAGARLLPRCAAVARSPAVKSAASSLSPYSATLSERAAPTRVFLRTLSQSARTRDAAATEQAQNEEGPEIRTFEDLQQLGVHPTLTDAIKSQFGYTEMTPVQIKSVRPALAGRDL